MEAIEAIEFRDQSNVENYRENRESIDQSCHGENALEIAAENSSTN